MIFNMTGGGSGGGAGLNFKVIGGVLRPSGGGGDTLTWDGNTEGLPNVMGMFFKVSDAIPSMDDLLKGGSFSVPFQGMDLGGEITEENMGMMAEGVLIISDFIVVISPDAVGKDFDGTTFPESGTYFLYTNEGGVFGFVSSLTINGYTGFGGGAPIKENTIWVNTDTEITGWALSEEEPAGAAGMVWLKTSEEGVAQFNALEKNGIMVGLVSAKQYVSGEWADRAWSIYQGGKWFVAEIEMEPDTVTVDSGIRTQYWSNASTTSDKWHNTSTNPGGVPFTNYTAYFGRNSGGAVHQMALCFKTGDFVGKSKAFSCKLRATSKWGWASGMASMWQLSRHDWSTAEAWQAGSKGYYSTALGSSAPADPNAVASGQFTVNNKDDYWITLNGMAELEPNTEYVIYIWSLDSYSGKLVEVAKTESTQPVITITG